MKKMKSFRKMLALVLALMMVVGIVSAHADTELTNCDFTNFVYDPNGLTVNVNESFNAQDNTSNIYLNDIDITGNLTVNVSAEGKTADVGLKSILGDETIIADKGIAEVDVNDKVGGKVSITASNSGEAYSLNGKDITGNVIINAETGGTAELTLIEVASYDNADIGGAATLTASGGGTVGLEAGDITGTTTVSSTGTAEGDAEKPSTVTVSAQDTGAVVSDVYSGGKADITVEDVKVEGTGSVAGVSVNQDNGQTTNKTTGNTTLVAGEISAQSTSHKGEAYGVRAYAGENTVNDIKTDDIKVSDKGGESFGYGLNLESNGGENQAAVGNIVFKDSHIAYGVKTSSENKGKNIVETGSITATDIVTHSIGVLATCDSGASEMISTGAIQLIGEADTMGIYAESSGEMNITVKGGIDTTGDISDCIGIDANARSSGIVNVKVEGDVTVKKLFPDYQYSSAYGVSVGSGNSNVAQGNGQIDVAVEGTLAGDSAAIRVDSAKGSAEKTDITVWAVKENKDQAIVVDKRPTNSTSADFVQTIESGIHYIVKLAGSISGTGVSVTTRKSDGTDDNKTVTFGKDDAARTYKTAQADGTVTVSGFTLADNEQVDGVYYYQDETDESKNASAEDGAWGKNDDGSIWVKMLRCGGMMLGLKIGTKAVQPDPDDKPEEKLEEKPEENKPEENKSEEKAEEKQEEKKEDKKEEPKSEVKKDETKQEAVQTVADTTSTIATTGTATVYNLLKIKDTSGKAELAFRNVGKYEIKSPDGNDEGSFGMEDGKIVLTSQTGKKMNIGQDGKLEYVIGNTSYEFKFGAADLEKLAAVK